MVEQYAENVCVVSSTLIGGTILKCWEVGQLVAHLTLNQAGEIRVGVRLPPSQPTFNFSVCGSMEDHFVRGEVPFREM